MIKFHTRKKMQKILKDVKSGKFAREWIKENEDGRPNFNKLRKAKPCAKPKGTVSNLEY